MRKDQSEIPISFAASAYIFRFSSLFPCIPQGCELQSEHFFFVLKRTTTVRWLCKIRLHVFQDSWKSPKQPGGEGAGGWPTKEGLWFSLAVNLFFRVGRHNTGPTAHRWLPTLGTEERRLKPPMNGTWFQGLLSESLSHHRRSPQFSYAQVAYCSHLKYLVPQVVFGWAIVPSKNEAVWGRTGLDLLLFLLQPEASTGTLTNRCWQCRKTLVIKMIHFCISNSSHATRLKRETVR